MPDFEKRVVEGVLNEAAEAGSANLRDLSRRFQFVQDMWPAMRLLQEDAYTRLRGWDTIKPEDIPEEGVDAQEVLSVLQAGAESTAEEKKREAHFSIAPEVADVRVHANAGALYFILRNAVYNPLKKDYVGASRVDVSVGDSSDQKSLVVTIHDDGYGFDPERLEDVFEPGGTGAKSKTEGTGLGMAYADKRLESMGGSIRIETDRTALQSEDDTKYGSTVTVEVPLKE